VGIERTSTIQVDKTST